MKKVLIIILFIVCIIFFGKLTSYKYIETLPEGSFTSDFYAEKNNHDVIFLGDCEVYTSFSPIELYQDYGITSFVRGNSQQLIPQSYYILVETLKYEKPKVVVLSVNAMRYSKNDSKEEYNRLLLDKMKLSLEKIKLYAYSKYDNESFISYLLPLFRYHNRITSLTSEDINYLFKERIVSHNGFLINQNVKPLEVLPSKKILDDYYFSRENYEYLEKMVRLCKDNNITLILEKSPTIYPYWYEEYDEQIISFSNNYHLDYYNFLNDENIGIDYQTDTYDAGIHLNLNGARKLTKYFGEILKDKYGLVNHQNDDKINNEYKEKIVRYNDEIFKNSN